MTTIIAVLGLPGSGKTEAINALMRIYGWPKVYFGEPTFEEMRRRGLAPTQENERVVREELRERFGEDHYAKEAMRRVEELLPTNPVVLVESLYSWAEYLAFREHFGDAFRTVAVFAPARVRYARLAERPERPLSPEQAWVRDKAQLVRLEQGGPIALADETVLNEGTLVELERGLTAALVRLGIVSGA